MRWMRQKIGTLWEATWLSHTAKSSTTKETANASQ